MSTNQERIEGLKKFIDSGPEEDEELQAFCNKKQIVLLAFVGSYVPRRHTPTSFVDTSINIADEFGMEEALKDIGKANGKKKPRAYFLINSRGGGLGSSFKIAQAVRDMFEDITVFVSHIASSGGTLLALTGDKIRMGAMSQLGPVDPQIPCLNYGYVSANSVTRAKKRLDEIFEKKHENEAGYPDRHMTEVLDPVMYEEFNGVRKECGAYLHTVLKKTKYEDYEINKITKWLLFNFPTHGFVIDKNIAAEIGLKISSDGDPNEWNLMRNWFAKYVGQEADRHFIRYCIPNRKKKI